jgi:transposase
LLLAPEGSAAFRIDAGGWLSSNLCGIEETTSLLVGTYRNVTTLDGIEITGREENLHRVVFDAKWAEPRSEIEACRQCGVVGATLHCHGPTSVKINDTPWGGKPVGIRLKKERYECQECDGTFTSRHPGIDDSHNITSRLAILIRKNGLKNPHIESLAGRFGLSVGTVWNLLRPLIEMDHEPPAPKRYLGIDEIYMPSDGPYTVFTDLWHGTIIELLQSNAKSDVREALKNIAPDPETTPDPVPSDPEKVRDPQIYGEPENYRIRAVAMDMDTRYRDVVNDVLPSADVIVDRYHLVDKTNDAANKVRRDTTSEKDEERCEERKAKGKPNPDDPEDTYTTEWKKKKEVFDSRWESLRPMEQLRLKQDLRQLPALKAAYFASNEFKKILDLTSVEEAKKALAAWENTLPESIQKPFEKVTGPLSEWRTEILNFFRHAKMFPFRRYTNGPTEALNGSIRQINTEGAHHRKFDVLKAKVIERLGPSGPFDRDGLGGEAILRGKQ